MYRNRVDMETSQILCGKTAVTTPGSADNVKLRPKGQQVLPEVRYTLQSSWSSLHSSILRSRSRLRLQLRWCFVPDFSSLSPSACFNLSSGVQLPCEKLIAAGWSQH